MESLPEDMHEPFEQRIKDTLEQQKKLVILKTYVNQLREAADLERME